MSWFDNKSDKQKSGKITKPEQQQSKVPDSISSANINNLTRNNLITLLQMKEAPKFQQELVIFLQKNIGNQAVCQLLKEAGLDKPKSANVNASAEKIKTNMENISGVSLADVKVRYNSEQPSKLGALAFTKGNEIHVAPGQEMHLPHEMWHAVQQKQGRVKPTGSIKGNKVNRSAVLEKEADVMGMKALSSVAKFAPSRSASKSVAAGKVVQKKESDKKDQGKKDKQQVSHKESRKAFDDWLDVWKKTQNASRIELNKLTEKLKKEDQIGFGDKFNRYNSGITNALGEEYERVSGEYYLSLSLTGLGLEVLRWVEDQGSSGKLPTYDDINKRAFDMLKEDEWYQTYVVPVLYVVIGGLYGRRKINSKASDTKTTSVKEPVKEMNNAPKIQAKINRRHYLNSKEIAKGDTFPSTVAPKKILDADLKSYNEGKFTKSGNDIIINGRKYGIKNEGETLFPRSGGDPEFLDLTRSQIKAIQILVKTPADKLDMVIKKVNLSPSDVEFAKEFIKRY
jgi:hypothetical protein